MINQGGVSLIRGGQALKGGTLCGLGKPAFLKQDVVKKFAVWECKLFRKRNPWPNSNRIIQTG